MTPSAPIGIEDARTLISEAPAPVLFMDTSAVLDIVRAPFRTNNVSIDPAVELARMSSGSPRQVHLVIDSRVHDEWEKHLDGQVDEVRDRVITLRMDLEALDEACRLCGLRVPALSWANRNRLPEYLRNVAVPLHDRALVLAREQDCAIRANERAVKLLRPARPGKNINDCWIIEHYLELCRRLRAAGLSHACVFVSSDTDYCGQPNVLHSDLDDAFQAVGLEFAVNFANAKRLVTI